MTAYFWMFLLGLLLGSAPGNDSIVTSQGGTLCPTQETVIALSKEVLTLRQTEAGMEAQIHFEFFNPKGPRELWVAFVTPPAYEPGDEALEPGEKDRHPDIEAFTVRVNGTSLPYQTQILDSSGFSFLKSQFGREEYLYYFPVRFEPGTTVIEHSYHFYGGMDNGGTHFFPYRLTSGKLWANREIGDFTLIVEMAAGSYFDVPSSFEERNSGDWALTGALKEGRTPVASQRRFYSKGGQLTFRAQHFRPDRDLMINVHPPLGMYAGDQLQSWDLWQGEAELKQLSPDELRILRNTFFALKGYAFQAEDLQSYFSPYAWYWPEPSLTSNAIFDQLPPEDQAQIRLMQQIEHAKRAQRAQETEKKDE